MLEKYITWTKIALIKLIIEHNQLIAELVQENKNLKRRLNE